MSCFLVPVVLFVLLLSFIPPLILPSANGARWAIKGGIEDGVLTRQTLYKPPCHVCGTARQFIALPHAGWGLTLNWHRPQAQIQHDAAGGEALAPTG